MVIDCQLRQEFSGFGFRLIQPRPLSASMAESPVVWNGLDWTSPFYAQETFSVSRASAMVLVKISVYP